MAVVTMRQLLESGVHFGHQTRRWNPKMKRFIMTDRNGIYIIDLQQSLSYIDNSFQFVKSTVAKGGSILFVGTKKQAQEAVSEQAKRVGMPFVNQRWLGGMLTNFQTVNLRLLRLKELEEINFDDVGSSGRTKKELLQLKREKDKLERTLGGVRDMARVPSAVWIVDTNKEHLAVDEARKLGIPIVAILDTNCDPDVVDYPIPGNDDAIRSVALLTRVVADAVAEGLVARGGAKTGNEVAGEELGAEEPLPEWEQELLGPSGTAEVAPAPTADPAAVVTGVSDAAAVTGVSDAAATPAVAPTAPAPSLGDAAAATAPAVSGLGGAGATAGAAPAAAPTEPVTTDEVAPSPGPVTEVSPTDVAGISPSEDAVVESIPADVPSPRADAQTVASAAAEASSAVETPTPDAPEPDAAVTGSAAAGS
jgi:small subunit ribosomal protein S2